MKLYFKLVNAPSEVALQAMSHSTHSTDLNKYHVYHHKAPHDVQVVDKILQAYKTMLHSIKFPYDKCNL